MFPGGVRHDSTRIHRGKRGAIMNAETEADLFAMQYLRNEVYPLGLERITRAVQSKTGYKIFLRYRDNMPNEIAAQLRRGDLAALVYVNNQYTEFGQRFAVCHEFAHLLLEHEYGILDYGLGENDWENDAANAFAATLLMPTEAVSVLVKKYHDSLYRLVKEMGERFKVSRRVAVRRLTSCDILPSLFALIDPSQGRLIWEHHSPSIYLDQEAFKAFLTRELGNNRSKWRETDLDIMGYPFRTEVMRLAQKVLVICLPFMAG